MKRDLRFLGLVLLEAMVVVGEEDGRGGELFSELGGDRFVAKFRKSGA